MTVRLLQLKKNGGQWLIGKTVRRTVRNCSKLAQAIYMLISAVLQFDNFAPIGPAIVTKQSLDPNNLAVKCRVNGVTLQVRGLRVCANLGARYGSDAIRVRFRRA